LSEIAFVDDLDEEQEEEEGMLLVCVLVGEYLSEKEERPTYVRNRMELERHIAELTAEGNYAFQYRMEYSSFLTLCTIIRPQVQVNAEMSRFRTGKHSIIVKIMLQCLLQWLGVGSYLDISLSAGISKTVFYNCIYKCIKVIWTLKIWHVSLQTLQNTEPYIKIAATT